jgi:cytochrome c oxidase subunit 4
MSDHKSDPHGHDEHGLAHVMSVPMLLAVGGILLFLTAVTVWVTAVDIGRTGNLLVAMVIATIKAGMVCAFFMHLRHDKPFNTLIFVSSVLFVGLFITILMLDKGEYEHDIRELELREGSN